MKLNESGNYFLTRRADHAVSFIDELQRLHTSKILLGDPQSSSSVIRDTDLHLAWLRSSLGTSAEHDKSLDNFRLRLDHGSLRPLPSRSTQSKTTGIKSLFSSFVLGAAITLHPNVTWPLDLFISPQARETYSEIHAYLFSLRYVHQRLLSSWRGLTGTRSSKSRTKEERSLEGDVWATMKLSLFWLDELLSHFMTDIIDIQHRALLSQLEGPEYEPTVRRSGSIATSLRGSRLQKSQSREHLSAQGLSASHASERGGMRPASPASTYAPETVRSRIPPIPNKHTAHLDFLTLRWVSAIRLHV